MLPIVEELQRRLPSASANFNGQGEEEDSGLQRDVETSEEDGMNLTICFSFVRLCYLELKMTIFLRKTSLSSISMFLVLALFKFGICLSCL